MTHSYNKSEELFASIKLQNDRLLFEGYVQENQPVSIDYVPPLGDNAGYTSLELLLLSLSSCIGSAVLTFLRKMRKDISGCEINSHGLRRQEHPTCFSKIFIEIVLKSSDTTSDDMDKVLKISEETYCPVWAMIRGNVETQVDYKIIP